MAKLLLLGLFAVLIAKSAAAPSCQTVDGKLLPCVSYIRGTGDPSSDCCGGVKDVSALANTKPDLVAVCNCIKADLPAIGNTVPSRIADLPKKCGINRDFPPVDTNYDCNQFSV